LDIEGGFDARPLAAKFGNVADSKPFWENPNLCFAAFLVIFMP
jgi:hypothetical protein